MRIIIVACAVLLGSNTANSLVVGFSKHDESRGALDTLFPFVDILEGGTTMRYFTGVRWGRSERTFLMLLPATGESG